MGNKYLLDLVELYDNVPGKDGDASIEKVCGKDIAIIGIGLKFPMADNAARFWDNLRNSVGCIRDIPAPRKKDVEDYLAFVNKHPAEITYEDAAYLDEIDQFDYRFFRLSPKEASLMDPNQRLFLQTAWTTLEDAGYGGQRLVGTRTGVYVGFGGDSEYKKLVAHLDPSSLSLAVTGNLPPIIASRLSYLLDLKGPSMLVNTVCSSSLLAVHLACQGIRNGECHLAIAGGVQTYVLPIRPTKVGIESSDFKTKTFDHSSDGTGSGEGVAAVLLKPLHKALKDRDHIYAVIKGGAVNQDGRSIGISAPNPAAQEDVMVRAWKDANIEPETISYIEAHGTGTKLGDPIEIEGITRAFARYTGKKQFCAIGSVKSNMGHLDNSAGIAGLIKAALALKNKEIPPTLHFNRPNRKIPFHRSPVYVNDILRPWKTNGSPRRCGVSSFSFSGTNCHLVLEEAPEIDKKKGEGKGDWEILTLSAETDSGLERLVAQYKKLVIGKEFNLKDICFTANTGRGLYTHRLALVLTGKTDLQKKIENLDIETLRDSQSMSDGVYYGVHRAAPPGKETAAVENGELMRRQIQELNKNARQILLEYKTCPNNREPLQQLCQLYIKGAEIDWDEWYAGQKRHRVSLPTYPFAQERCWLQIPVQEKEGLYYTIGWKEEALTGGENIESLQGSVLIMKDNQGVGDAIAGRLRQEGKTVLAVDAITGSEADYERLMGASELKALRQIIHVQSLTLKEEKSSDAVRELENQLDRGVYSLLRMVRVLHRTRGGKGDIDIVLVSDHVHEVTRREPFIQPGNASFFGLGRVVNMENVNLKCRTVDIDSQTPVDCIFREINAGYTTYKVAYRSGSRYIEEMEAVDITTIPGKDVTIKQEGVYIITGGTGGLGLEIAGYFASKNKVNLALIHRTPIPERREWDQVMESEKYPGLAHKVSLIREIEKKGARVLCCCADAANEVEIKNAIHQIRNKFGRINGIVHCAGVGSGRQGKRIEEDSENIFREVMAPKVRGTWLLDRLTRDPQPDFFVVFSSPITLVGGIGSGSYTAANAYLDAFACYRNRSNQKTTAMSWAPWEETIKKMNTRFDSNRHLFEVLSTAEIFNAFDQVLSKELPLVIIGKLNYKSEIFYLGDRLPLRVSGEIENRVKNFQKKSELEFNKNIGSKKEHIKVRLTGRDNNQYSQYERQMAQIYGQFLGYKELSIYDNFYELGGDSIIAVKIIHAINRQMQLDIKAEELLKKPTIKEFARLLSKKNIPEARESTSCSPVPPIEKKKYYPLSPSQRRLYVIWQLNNRDTAYNMPTVWILEGKVDINGIENTFKQLIKRHESLRTSFEIAEEKPVQRVHGEVEFEVENFDLAAENIGQTTESKPDTHLSSEFIRPFDLSRAPLLRVGLIKKEDEKYIMTVDMHHIISDGVSNTILLNEFTAIYDGETLPRLRLQYKDFFHWREKWLSKEKMNSQKEYWLRQFEGTIPVLDMPTDFPRSWPIGSEGDNVYFTINKELNHRLRILMRETGTTLYMVLLAVFNVLLLKHTGQQDMVVGSPITGRSHPDLQSIIGMFVNMLSMRNFPRKEKKFEDFLGEVKENALKAYQNQDFQFDELIRKVGLQGNIGRNPLFDVVFQLDNMDRGKMERGDFRMLPSGLGPHKVQFDLTLGGEEIGEEIRMYLVFATALFKRDTAKKLTKWYMEILEKVAKYKEIKLRDIKISHDRLAIKTGISPDDREDFGF